MIFFCCHSGTPGNMLKSQTTEQLPVKLRSDESHPSHVPRKETFWYLVLQVLFPFIIAGMGMACAGMVFAEVQVNKYFFNIYIRYKITELLIDLMNIP